MVCGRCPSTARSGSEIMKIAFFRYLSVISLFTAALFAQRDTASLVGQVRDSTGAVVAGADIVAENIETNYKYQAQSDASGVWTLSPVRIGTYRVSVSSHGFKTAVAGP